MTRRSDGRSLTHIRFRRASSQTSAACRASVAYRSREPVSRDRSSAPGTASLLGHLQRRTTEEAIALVRTVPVRGVDPSIKQPDAQPIRPLPTDLPSTNTHAAQFLAERGLPIPDTDRVWTGWVSAFGTSRSAGFVG